MQLIFSCSSISLIGLNNWRQVIITNMHATTNFITSNCRRKYDENDEHVFIAQTIYEQYTITHIKLNSTLFNCQE